MGEFEMGEKIVVGFMGSSQIQHIMPAVGTRHRVVNVQEALDGCAGRFAKLRAYVGALREVDVLYNVFTGPGFWKKARIAKLMGKRVVTHWIGSDALAATEGATDVSRLAVVDRHLACFEPISLELGKLGLEADVMPIVPYEMDFDLCRMPEKHAALVYMPEGREDLYGLNTLRSIFGEFSNLPFFIVANANTELFKSFSNVEVLGNLTRESMSFLYEQVSVLVRPTRHDGLSMMVLESLAKGKQVIWSQRYPHVLPGTTAEQISDSLRMVLGEPPSARRDAHDFVASEFSRESFLDEFERLVVS